jgi:anti-sigma factor RsiW
MTDRHGISDEELHAYIDGEIDDVRAAEIAKLAAADSALAERIAAFKGDKQRLAQIYGPFADRPLPPGWQQRVERGAIRRGYLFSEAHFPGRRIAAIAAILLLMLGLGFTYNRFILPKEDTIIAEAVAARQETMRPEQSLPATASATPDGPDQVLTTALAMMLKAPDLTRLGYRLENIRVYGDVPGGKAVELSYRNPQNRLFTLYLRHPSGPARVDLIERDGMRLCIWQDDVLGTVMLGEMSAGEMARMASLAYAGLTL